MSHDPSDLLFVPRSGKHIDELALHLDGSDESPYVLRFEFAWLRDGQLIEFTRDRSMLIVNRLHFELNFVQQCSELVCIAKTLQRRVSIAKQHSQTCQLPLADIGELLMKSLDELV